jgi:hypothetical protein
MARDIVFGSLEHIVWTARVQHREDQIDVEKLSRDLAAAYLRALGLREEYGKEHRAAVRREARRPARHRRAVGARHTRRD